MRGCQFIEKRVDPIKEIREGRSPFTCKDSRVVGQSYCKKHMKIIYLILPPKLPILRRV